MTEEVGGHGPRVDVPNPVFELWRHGVPPGLYVSSVAIAELKGPHDSEAISKHLPEQVRAVLVLRKHKAFSDAWPVYV